MPINLITEQPSKYDQLENMSLDTLIENINHEDQSVAIAVKNASYAIVQLVRAIVPRMKRGGRLFYIGAGTSGRLGILDASECPPTFGVSADVIIGLIAGGDTAIRSAVEAAEDNPGQAWKDMLAFGANELDTVIGIAASGQTPYVIGGLKDAGASGLLTGCVVCNLGSPVAMEAQFAVEVVTGPEFISGSTRMKAGTAQKMVLNMISTAIMIQLGHIKGNLMVDMKLSNSKLWKRGIRMVVQKTGLSEAAAKKLIEEHGNVRKALSAYANTHS